MRPREDQRISLGRKVPNLRRVMDERKGFIPSNSCDAGHCGGFSDVFPPCVLPSRVRKY